MRLTGGLVLWAALSFCLNIGAQTEAQLHAVRASEFLKSKRPDLAIREFAAIVALEPDNADAHANLGVLTYFQGDYVGAAPELRTAHKLRPDLLKIQALLGLCEKRLGETAGARTDLEQAFPQLNEEKLRVEAGMELTEIYYAGNDLDKAAAVITTLRQLRPTDTDILYTAYRIYSDLAEESILSVVMTAPDSARMHQLMANQLARKNNVDAAIEQYRQALKIDPALPGAHFQLAEMLEASPDRRAQAEKEYQEALVENPLDAKSLCRLGEIALERSDPKSALTRYTRALELQPDDADANLGLAKALMETGQSRKAELPLLRAAALEPFEPAIHWRLATLYRESGRAADAAKELAEFRRLKELKHRLEDAYRDMRLRPPREDPQDETSPTRP